MVGDLICDFFPTSLITVMCPLLSLVKCNPLFPDGDGSCCCWSALSSLILREILFFVFALDSPYFLGTQITPESVYSILAWSGREHLLISNLLIFWSHHIFTYFWMTFWQSLLLNTCCYWKKKTNTFASLGSPGLFPKHSVGRVIWISMSLTPTWSL